MRKKSINSLLSGLLCLAFMAPYQAKADESGVFGHFMFGSWHGDEQGMGSKFAIGYLTETRTRFWLRSANFADWSSIFDDDEEQETLETALLYGGDLGSYRQAYWGLGLGAVRQEYSENSDKDDEDGIGLAYELNWVLQFFGKNSGAVLGVSGNFNDVDSFVGAGFGLHLE